MRRAANGWTGGQYGVVRVLLAVAVATGVSCAGGGSGVRAVALAATVALAAGWADRTAALLLAGLWPLAVGDAPLGSPFDFILVPGVLLVHAAVPRAPFGSVAARGRVDPGGGWRRSRRSLVLTRVLLAVAVGGEAGLRLVGGADLAPALLTVLQVAALPFLLRGRGGAWVVAAVCHAALLAAGAPPVSVYATPLLFALAFDPGWLPPSSPRGPLLVLYDGTCGVCHGTVRLLLAEDASGQAFRFAPLGGAAFAAAIPPASRAGLPDSIVVVAHDGAVLVRAASTIEIARALGGLWRVLAAFVALLPRRLADAAYDVFAANRKRLFATPADACPLMPAHLRARFPDLPAPAAPDTPAPPPTTP
jgi:predicted DCC family thiol-disulfide oxidoreductase YuxK